jgi:hypothetical protein
LTGYLRTLYGSDLQGVSVVRTRTGGDYSVFLDRKSQLTKHAGFAPTFLPDCLFDFQKFLVDWGCRSGCGAFFADCGLGKTLMQLVWAENVVRQTNKPTLILTPLAVARQTVAEAAKFGIDCQRSAGEVAPGARIVVTNYEKLHLFSPHDFSGVVCDESSAIKAFDGKRRADVTDFLRKMPYRLLCTATAAPNDYVELGTSSEAIGELGYMDMLNRFFVNDQNTSDTKRNRQRFGDGKVGWRFKGHAEVAFWRWVCSWARACRRPSDLGFSDEAFHLPDLIERETVVETRTLADGCLFAMPATDFFEEREERRRTIDERCEAAANLVADTDQPAVIWCHLNDEGDKLVRMIDGARQVSGKDSDEEKEETFADFASGDLRVLVIKPKIGAWGLNWQHCAHVVTFASHSYEQYYQSIRRCWRFGQKRPVVVDLVATEGEGRVKANMRRKAEAADRMFAALVSHMNESQAVRRTQAFEKEIEAPSWL